MTNLYAGRRARLTAEMQAQGKTQMVLCDTWSIYYLTGQFLHSGERMQALVLRTDKDPILLMNRLLLWNCSDVPTVEYHDATDPMGILETLIDKTKPLGVDKNWGSGRLLEMMRRNMVPSFYNASLLVDDLRARKDLAEQQALIAASRINDAAVARMIPNITIGMTERDIATQIEQYYYELGAEGPCFALGVSFGANVADPHHGPDDTVLKHGDVVLMDVGCRKDGYCSDMTRTVFVGDVTAEQERVYNLVKQASDECEAMMQLNLPLADLDAHARKIIGDGGYAYEFNHRLGHLIGIETHDPGEVSIASPLHIVPGMAFTIEPGIYLPGKFGVRIENTCMAQETGCVSLNAVPKDLQVIKG